MVCMVEVGEPTVEEGERGLVGTDGPVVEPWELAVELIELMVEELLEPVAVRRLDPGELIVAVRRIELGEAEGARRLVLGELEALEVEPTLSRF